MIASRLRNSCTSNTVLRLSSFLLMHQFAVEATCGSGEAMSFDRGAAPYACFDARRIVVRGVGERWRSMGPGVQ